MRLHSLLLPSFVLLSLSTAACSLKLGDKTQGEKGTMTFAYDGPHCFFGCGLDRSALQGSLVTVSASGTNADVRPTARISSDARIASVSSQRESCSCGSKSGSQSSSHSVDAGAKCSSGETKTCTLSIDIETTAEGDAELEVVDPKGALIDRVAVHVRPAARIDVEVNNAAVKDGEISTVRIGDKVGLKSHAFDADGTEEIFTKHGISHDYGDNTIVKPDDSALFGSTDVEDMVAVEPGDTTVTVGAPGAQRVVRFHVVN